MDFARQSRQIKYLVPEPTAFVVRTNGVRSFVRSAFVEPTAFVRTNGVRSAERRSWRQLGARVLNSPGYLHPGKGKH
jgi:hypothetical protein